MEKKTSSGRAFAIETDTDCEVIASNDRYRDFYFLPSGAFYICDCRIIRQSSPHIRHHAPP